MEKENINKDQNLNEEEKFQNKDKNVGEEKTELSPDEKIVELEVGDILLFHGHLIHHAYKKYVRDKKIQKSNLFKIYKKWICLLARLDREKRINKSKRYKSVYFEINKTIYYSFFFR